MGHPHEIREFCEGSYCFPIIDPLLSIPIIAPL